MRMQSWVAKSAIKEAILGRFKEAQLNHEGETLEAIQLQLLMLRSELGVSIELEEVLETTDIQH